MRLLALAALLAAVPALAQDTVVLAPGHADLATAAVTVRDVTLDVRIVQPSVQSLGTISETVTQHDDGTVTVMRAIDLSMPGGNGQSERDTTRFAWPSLAPVSYASTDLNGGDREQVRFDGLRMTGSYGDNGATPLAFDLSAESPVFGPGSIALIARAVPLREGYTATAPTFSGEHRFRDAAIEVVGREDATRRDGSTVSAFVVESSVGGRTQRYFVDPETRDLLKMTVAPAPGYLVEATPR
ncbi:hypothetical protein [Rubrivirga sp. IMCC43871]|uniref:DUF3108 domain-containing protein n=1 Tax=Rubrivirga sp. IMCC43871 TaxID=3391575 RepID=UPI0039903625